MYRLATMHSFRQTDGHTDRRHHANSRSHYMQYDQLTNQQI